MKHIINIAGYLLVVAGGSFVAWLIYGILAETYITTGTEVAWARTTRPRIAITSPATSVISQPMIQIIGFFPEEITEITGDITSVAGTNANETARQLTGYVTGQFFDRAKFDRITQENFKNRFKPWKPGQRTTWNDSAFTTNFFQIYDVNLAPGKNRIRIYITDRNGKHYTAKRFYTLDLASDKTPPVLNVTWPKDNSQVAGDDFTLDAQVDDNNATVKTTIENAQGKVEARDAIVERSGRVWVKNLPLSPGLNKVMIVATDAAGNSSTNHLAVRRSSVSVTIAPLAGDQLNKPLVDVHGTVSNQRCRVKVNNVAATVHADGTWEAHEVPVSPTGVAEFKIDVFGNPGGGQ